VQDPITFLANDPTTYTDNETIATNATTTTTAASAYRPRYFGLTKIYPWGDRCAPYFPDKFDVVKKVIFHVSIIYKALIISMGSKQIFK
jgi:hypothetical protein